MQKVSTFLNVRVGAQRYVFLLVTGTSYDDAVWEEIRRHFEPFGADLGEHGTVIQAFERRADSAYREVRSKWWDSAIDERMSFDPYPFLLIVKTDFADFDPRTDPWAIVWFSDLAAQPQNVKRLFALLAAKTRADENLFAYLMGVTEPEDGSTWTGLGASVDAGAILRESADEYGELTSPPPGPRIFISYRRDDSQADTGRLSDALTTAFGQDRVFMDIDAIPPGVDFAHAITEAVGSCDALIAVIGPHWLTLADPRGQRRLDDPNDFVRLEIKAALERYIRVIPVLVREADMPSRGELPDDPWGLRAYTGLRLSEALGLTWAISTSLPASSTSVSNSRRHATTARRAVSPVSRPTPATGRYRCSPPSSSSSCVCSRLRSRQAATEPATRCSRPEGAPS
jgi:TIR domain